MNHSMTEWKAGDTVSFIETGTIAHIADGIATVDVRGIPHTMHVSHIIGTPEQAKRERIMATLRREFPMFCFEKAKDSERGFFWTRMQEAPNEQIDQWLDAINARIKELETQA